MTLMNLLFENLCKQILRQGNDPLNLNIIVQKTKPAILNSDPDSYRGCIQHSVVILL